MSNMFDTTKQTFTTSIQFFLGRPKYHLVCKITYMFSCLVHDLITKNVKKLFLRCIKIFNIVTFYEICFKL